MAAGFGDFTHRMERLSREMDGRALQARLTRVGVLSKVDINEAVRADLGDMSMSGWRRGNPHEIVGRFDVEGSTVAMTPAKRGRGPMRVLQQGRNPTAKRGEGIYAAGAQRFTKSGAPSRAKVRRARRWNGTTQGKGTWTDATEIMKRKMPDRYERALRADIARHIKGS